MRPVAAELDPTIGQDAVAGRDLGADLAAMGVALAPGDKKGAGGADRKPPAVIGVALVEDLEPAPAQEAVIQSRKNLNSGLITRLCPARVVYLY
jgi:hypothetical protein